jgi:dTMP kinase
MEQQPAEFYERVRGAYRELAEREPNRIVLIDGSGAPDKIEHEIWEVISARFSALALAPKSKIENRKSKI